MRKMKAESLADLVNMAARLRISRATGANTAPIKNTTHTMVPTDTIV
jgi:hypothetical protein